jgi:hypothetical protein
MDARAANELQGTAMLRDRERYAAALASKHLTPVELTMYHWELPIDPVMVGRGGYVNPQPIQTNGVVERERPGPVGSKRGRFIMAGARVPNCQGEPLPEFVRDGSKIYRVARAPRVVKTTKVAACAPCVPQPGFTCGGAVMAPEELGFELPDGTTYEGPIEIVFDSEVVEITIDAKKPCPAVPPPP